MDKSCVRPVWLCPFYPAGPARTPVIISPRRTVCRECPPAITPPDSGRLCQGLDHPLWVMVEVPLELVVFDVSRIPSSGRHHVDIKRGIQGHRVLTRHGYSPANYEKIGEPPFARSCPPGRLDRAVHYSWHGALHDLFSLLAFVALAAACFVFGSRFAGRGERRWAIYSAVSGAVFAIAFVLSSAGFGQAAGLMEVLRASSSSPCPTCVRWWRCTD